MSGTSGGIDDLFSDSHAQVPKKRRGVTAIVVGVLVIILAVGVVWADGAARAAAEGVVEGELSDRLPEGSGPVEASIGGFAFLPQFFSGTLNNLDVTFAVDGASIPALAGDSSAASNLQISDGVLSHEGAVEFLGMEVGYTVILEPSVEGGAVVLTPTTIEATTDAASIDLSQLVDLSALTVRACAASLLPESVQLRSVEAVGSKLHFAVSGQDVPVDLSKLRTRGSCG
jgi:hypothetical protein